MNLLYRSLLIFLCLCFAKNSDAQIFNLGNSGSNSGWYKLGRLYLPQQGEDAELNIVSGGGYNANPDQMGECSIHFRTSNGNSENSGFYASGSYYNTGRKVIDSLRIVQVNLELWDFYAYLPAFTGSASLLILKSVSGNWTSDMVSGTIPANSIYLAPREQLYYSSDIYFGRNVGIGTTDTQSYRFAVNGKIRAQEIKVEASPWPDYVFTKDYPLPTLQQTEQHIKEKGHLPGIPSAAEVKANGINLGEMDAKLLQKIEELTVHLIEMKKKNEELNQRLLNVENKKRVL